MGSKALLADFILRFVEKNMVTVRSVLDIFSGTGIVTNTFRERGYGVTCNDFLYFCFVLARGSAGIRKSPDFKLLGFDPLPYLNSLTLAKSNFSLDDCFIYQNFSPNSNCERMYFQNNNAIKIDIIRLTIENWKNLGLLTEDEYFYLLASLLNAVPYVANITGVYAAYLKYWDKRTYNQLLLKKCNIIGNLKPARCYNLDFTKLLKESCDLLYADPPYNSRQYLSNYHILETIALYDRPKLHGKTGIRDLNNKKSQFCNKSIAINSFDKLIKDCKCRYIIISYNNEGLVDSNNLAELCRKYSVPGSFKLIELDYRRYKNKIPNNNPGLKEQLYFLRRY